MFLCFSHFNPIKIKHLHDASFEKKLGEGTFGKVKIYKCKEKNCNGNTCEQCFVVKKIKVCSFKDKLKYLLTGKHHVISYINKKAEQILLNEWEVGKDLNHINIIKTLDIDICKLSLIFEYYESIDLYNYISDHQTHNLGNIFEYPLKTKNEYSIDIYKQILNGLSYLHENNVVHLDLKLENIIINPKNRLIKIIDFGKGIKIHNNNNIIQLCKSNWGTLQYIPPEYFYKSKFVDLFKIDIWTCGILLYNLIYNLFPWNRACKKTDEAYKLFLKYSNLGILRKEIFSDLYQKAWNIENIHIINHLFLDIFKEDYETRIELPEIINRVKSLKF